MELDGFTFSDHPLVTHKLTQMRRGKTSSRDFDRLMREMGMLMAYEATKSLSLTKVYKDVRGEKKKEMYALGENKPVIAPILRTGLIMAEGIREIISSTYTAHIGLHHEFESQIIIDYLFTLPEIEERNNRLFIIVDPIIYTGITASIAVTKLIEAGINYDSIRFVSIAVSPQGRDRINNDHDFNVKVNAAFFDDDPNNSVIADIGSVSERLYRTKRPKSL